MYAFHGRTTIPTLLEKNMYIYIYIYICATFQDHYPDTIGKVLVAPVNTVLYVIWGLVSLIIDETTKSRLTLVKVRHMYMYVKMHVHVC